MRLEPPHVRILGTGAHNFVQPLQPAIVLADSLVKFQVQASQRRAVLEFGLVVNVRGTEAVDLDASCCNQSSALCF